MSSESSNTEDNAGQGAAQQDEGVISYALEALSALGMGELESALPQPLPAAQGAADAPTAPEALTAPEAASAHAAPAEAAPGAEGSPPQNNLQAALDWYKDWLSSI